MILSVHNVMRQRLHAQAGIDRPQPTWTRDRFRRLLSEQWSPRFEVLMRNRLAMGMLRYGPLRAAGKPQYDRLGSIIRRAQNYLATGNDELLVDIANLAMLEFVEGIHPHKHFSALDLGPGCQQKTKPTTTDKPL